MLTYVSRQIHAREYPLPRVSRSHLTRLPASAAGHKLFFMSKMALLLCLLSALVVGESGSNISQDQVVLTSLSNPVYPRLAIQARVVGDVELKLLIRQDGTVDSAEAVRGPSMLVQGALDSAKNSKFNCSSCTETLTSSQLVHSFQFGPALVCANPGATDEKVHLPGYPQVTYTNDRVILIDQPVGELCSGDSILKPMKVRSAKCLYLGKCDLRYPL